MEDSRLSTILNLMEEKANRAFYLISDIKRAQLGLALLIVPILHFQLMITICTGYLLNFVSCWC